ncbi:MAG: gfo/Idh/MocA family oxidoreductase, partial [Burkholderiaceae bacterium]|nr:gfo/Idh/MocA family oxidoreductase [Burkholderiaceae bacterium]
FIASLERLLIGEVLIHHLDVVRWLLGPLTVAAVHAGRRCEAVRGEDHAQLMLTGAGLAALVDASLVVPGAPAQPVDAFELLGTHGAATLEGRVLRLAGRREERIELDLDDAYRASYAGAIGHFTDCLRTGATFETDPQDNLRTLALVEEAYAARVPKHLRPLDSLP